MQAISISYHEYQLFLGLDRHHLVRPILHHPLCCSRGGDTLDVEVQYGDSVLVSMQAEPGEGLVTLGSCSGAGVVYVGQNEGYIGTYHTV